jgi:hypothetical protein
LDVVEYDIGPQKAGFSCSFRHRNSLPLRP